MLVAVRRDVQKENSKRSRQKHYNIRAFAASRRMAGLIFHSQSPDENWLRRQVYTRVHLSNMAAYCLRRPPGGRYLKWLTPDGVTDGLLLRLCWELEAEVGVSRTWTCWMLMTKAVLLSPRMCDDTPTSSNQIRFIVYVYLFMCWNVLEHSRASRMIVRTADAYCTYRVRCTPGVQSASPAVGQRCHLQTCHDAT